MPKPTRVTSSAFARKDTKEEVESIPDPHLTNHPPSCIIKEENPPPSGVKGTVMIQNAPLADALRPKTMDDIVGQAHLFGKNGVLRRMVEAGRMTNMIFFGPPGTGKTTAASVIAARSGMEFHKLNATTASLQDVKDILAQTEGMFGANGILLYLDEIQYFNRKQQQSLLEYMEDGRITLIASTTENPHFYVYNAIRSPRQNTPRWHTSLWSMACTRH